MKSTRLEMNFKSQGDKNYRISIKDANELLSEEEILESMNSIVDQDVFHVDLGSLSLAQSARYVTTTVRQVF